MKLLASLTNRIFLASAALAVLGIGFAVYFVSGRVTAEAEEELRRGLLEASTIVDRHRTTLSEQFMLRARLVADLPTLKAAVATGDPATVAPVAREYYQLGIRSDLCVVTDRAGRVLASLGDAPTLSSGGASGTLDFDAALGGEEAIAFWPHSAGLMQVVTVPVLVGRAPSDLLGTLSLGLLLDDRMAAEFKAITGSDIAFALDGRVRAATLSVADRPALVRLLGKPGVSPITLGSDEYVALQRPLFASGYDAAVSGAPVDESRVPVVIVLRSRTERLRSLETIRTALAVAAAAAVALAVVLSYGIARTVTRPLSALTARMREMAATGDFTRKIIPRGGRWDDEDARLLTATFNTLVDAIGRFQRERAQRERLSSLGRLSTVIAHEIRNPLMIMKASLRALPSGPLTPEAREAAADIREEIDRLNRIVTDVLDFARPLRFDIDTVDLHAICRASVEAVRGAGAAPPFRLTFDPRVPALRTDGEYLRTALVNVLSNAAQAVTAAAESGERDLSSERLPDVEVRTTYPSDGRVTIAVRDRGIGIPADVLPHVFDPYFTTRRTGTGLGLAIAKNIVEGLGGTIDVTSEPGRGTEMVIELPTVVPAQAPVRDPTSGDTP